MTPGVVAETDLAGTLKSEYVFFDGERVARRDGATGTGGVFYYFSDHLKTASVITDSAGVIKAESDYYPWGGELQFVNNDSNHYKYGGHERDNETSLDYYGARYHSNQLARFLSPDWSAIPVPVPYADLTNPQTLNQYAYVHNNPTSYGDPDGHQDTATDVKVDMEVVKALLATVGPAAGPAVAAAGPAAVLAAPSAVGMGLAIALPPMQNTPDGSPNLILDALNPPYIPAPPVEGQAQETEHQPEPAPASAAPPMKGNGRGGRQERLQDIGNDQKASSAHRGWIKNEERHMQNGNRTSRRVPPGHELAHKRGKEARKGYDYFHSDLQEKKLHQTQHQIERQKKKE
jgi:RHS repeat-associated protein